MEFNLTWISLSITGILTIFIYTYLYKENYAFRLAEHILIGSFTGHTVVMAVKTVRETGFNRVLFGGELLYIIPCILGLIFFLRYIKGLEWLTRYPLAFMIGTTAGVEARARFQGWVWKQLQVTISEPLNNLNAIIIFLTVVTIMTYFVFTVKHTGPLAVTARAGRIVLLLTFGMTIAYDAVNRMGEITSRFDWLYKNVPYVTIATVFAFGVYIVYDLYVKKPRSDKLLQQ